MQPASVFENRLSDFVSILAEDTYFTQVGNAPPGEVSRVSSWQEAHKYLFEQLRWLNFRNAISNHLRERRQAIAIDKDEMRSLIDRLQAEVDRKIANDLAWIEEHCEVDSTDSPSARSFAYHVRWDLSFAGSEFLLQDVLKPIFFEPLLLPLYRAGHFPCGWDGAMINQNWSGPTSAYLPKGRLRVL